MPPTCSRYSVCRHCRPRSHHSGLAVYHPVVCCRRPGKINFYGKYFLRDDAEKWNPNLVSGQLPGDGQEYFVNIVSVLR